MGEDLTPKPSNLADADWKHGATDGEIFTVIRDGVKGSGMKAYSGKLTTRQLWDVVNYVAASGRRRLDAVRDRVGRSVRTSA